jgi:hypothetical protein
VLGDEEVDEEMDDSSNATGAAAKGSVPGGAAPTRLPAGGAPSTPDVSTAAGANESPFAGAGGTSGVNLGGAAGSVMNVGAAAGGAMNVPGAAGGANAGAAGSAMPPIGGAGTDNALGSVLLSPVDGWVSAESNALGIQGSVFFEVDANDGGPSTLSLVSDGPAVCVSGVSGPVQDSDFARDWGGLFGIRLGEASPGQIGTWSPITPVGTLTGFTFRVTGPQVPLLELRFHVQDGSGIDYCTGARAGTYSINIATLLTGCGEAGGTSFTPELPLVSLSWEIIAIEARPVPFDFCIEDLTAILQ